ncbi:hypothetical protein [Roseateles sp.]|uniref:hypothetical protein n=1 Tax=Roseateles sp. TaxID=1971397 RepID=UPI0026014AD0|nr:hypothetical protein [Roseateles sp.]MBV8035185.1 hypothetical protein [Roseateles sp.]
MHAEPVLSTDTTLERLDRFAEAQRREFARLQGHFRGAVRAQLKPLAAAIGVAERTVRNNFNTLRINGQEIRPSQVCGRVTFDLEEVAHALALGAIQTPPPARVVARKERVPATPKGRGKKADLAAQIQEGAAQ